MPGGYGTEDTPWGAGGTRAPSGSYSRSAGPARGGGSSVTQGSNRVAEVVNNPRSTQADISNAIAVAGQSGGGGMTYDEQALQHEKATRLQAALSMAAAGISNVGGREAGPGIFSLTDPIGVNWDDSTYGLYDYNPLHGKGKYWFDELGYLGKGENSPSFPGGGGGGWGGWGGGYGGGGGGGYGGYGPSQERPPIQGQRGEQWGAQTPWQQMMINTHAGKGFQQGYARGGIVSLVE
jgi:hypothetical protein